MKNRLKKLLILTLAALMPLLLNSGFAMSQNNAATHTESTMNSADWNSLPIDRVIFHSDNIKMLTVELNHEKLGNQRAEVLQPIIMQIFVALKSTNDPTPAILTDLLRDLSVEHPDNDIRLIAYSTMISALINETESDDTSDDLVLN